MYSLVKSGEVWLDDGTIIEISPGSYEVSEITNTIKQEMNDNVIIELNKITMECKMNVIERVLNFDLD